MDNSFDNKRITKADDIVFTFQSKNKPMGLNLQQA
jgi:hypothetical protein